MITLLCRSDLTVGTGVTELGNRNAVGVTESQGGRAKWQHSTAKGKVGVIMVIDNRIKAAISMTHADLGH